MRWCIGIVHHHCWFRRKERRQREMELHAGHARDCLSHSLSIEDPMNRFVVNKRPSCNDIKVEGAGKKKFIEPTDDDPRVRRGPLKLKDDDIKGRTLELLFEKLSRRLPLCHQTDRCRPWRTSTDLLAVAFSPGHCSPRSTSENNARTCAMTSRQPKTHWSSRDVRPSMR